jgi:hypothetical protein
MQGLGYTVTAFRPRWIDLVGSVPFGTAAACNRGKSPKHDRSMKSLNIAATINLNSAHLESSSSSWRSSTKTIQVLVLSSLNHHRIFYNRSTIPTMLIPCCCCAKLLVSLLEAQSRTS